MKLPAPKPMNWFPEEIDHHRFDCGQRVAIALERDHSLRGMIGFLLERATSDEGQDTWITTCGHHCWAINQHGAVVETSMQDFADPLDGYELLGEPEQRRWIQIRPGQQERVFKLCARNELRSTAELAYFPGRVARNGPPPRYRKVWGGLAEQCTADGGWTHQQWQLMISRLPGLLGLNDTG